MISITGKKWKEKNLNKNLINKTLQDTNFSEILSKLIISKKFDDEEMFSINNNIELTNKFIHNVDFNDSAKVILKAISNKDKICILGDYDVDGSTSTALLINFFKHINHPYFYYIPDREKDGYGASVKLFKKLIIKKPKLIIMVDCGSNSNEAIEFLISKNIKSVIIDHHEIQEPFPRANCIINPKKNNGYQQYDYLCATSLTYFFLEILIDKDNIQFQIQNFLIYVLLATVCDVMPLRKLNRIIALNVIKNFKILDNEIISEIYNQLNKNNQITIDDLGYFIGPILNSGGRLGKSSYATELLTCVDSKKIKLKIEKLILLNNKRKIIEKKILDNLNFDKIERENKKIIIIYEPNINEGLIGIIASRLKDYFNKPSIVITNSKNFLKGSARSTNDFNIGSAINNALNKKIIINGGGHKMAAGFTLKNTLLNLFIEHIDKSYLNFNINNNLFFFDAKVSTRAFNNSFFNEINKLKPFGTGNIEPLFLFEGLKIIKTKILKKRHIFSVLKSINGFSINSISFNSVGTIKGEYLLNYKKKVNVIGQMKQNFWNNKYTLQLTVKDLIIDINKT